MYTYIGRTIYLFFLGLFCIALNSKGPISNLVGIFTFLNALLNCFVVYRHGNLYSDPTQKYATADDLAKNYAADNPELTKKAFTSGINFAKNNPNLVKSNLNLS